MSSGLCYKRFLKLLNILFRSVTFIIRNMTLYNLKEFNLIYSEGDFGVELYLKDTIPFTYQILKIEEQNTLELSCEHVSLIYLIIWFYQSPSTNEQSFLNCFSILNHVTELKTFILYWVKSR